MPELNPPGDNWPDSRIDDLANTIWSMREIPMKVAVLENNLERLTKEVAEEVARCARGIEEIRQQRDRERKERERAEEKRVERENAERERKSRERKSDRRWLVGTSLTVIAVVIAALALFLG